MGLGLCTFYFSGVLLFMYYFKIFQVAFLRQFFALVTKVDNKTMRRGFINVSGLYFSARKLIIINDKYIILFLGKLILRSRDFNDFCMNKKFVF